MKKKRDDRGATLVEYAFLLAFITLAVVGVLTVLGAAVPTLYDVPFP